MKRLFIVDGITSLLLALTSISYAALNLNVSKSNIFGVGNGDENEVT